MQARAARAWPYIPASMLRLLVVVAFAAVVAAQTPSAAAPRLRTASLFGDHMVLPAASKAPLWGRTAPGAAVEVRGSWGETARTVAAADGRFRVELATAARGGPFEVTLAAADETVVLRDVLLGDVWLGSGQSNMEMQLGKSGWSQGVRDYERELAGADLPLLRFFTVARATAATPQDDVEGHWEVSTPRSAAACSAVGWLFAADLVRSGHGPIGLVVSSWGGTVAEAWTRQAGLAPFPEFAPAIAQLRGDGGAASRQARLQRFWRAIEAAGTAIDASTAQDVTLPERWSQNGLDDFDGVVEYRRTIEVPASLRGQDCWLELGAIDDMDTVFCDGVRLGGAEDDGAWSSPRRYAVPAASLRKERVELRVRVVDTGGEGGFTADAAALRLARQRGDDVDSATALALAGTWQRRLGPALRELPAWPRQDGGPNRPTVLWNAMIAPLVPFPFAGVIWYQGEANRHRHAQYARLFPAMITDWRAAFGRELPFYFVQLAPFGYDDEHASGGLLTPQLREAQAAALALPHTGMVVTLDCGDAGDIHPIDKAPVGKRLAALARTQVYGEQVPCVGPTVAAVRQDGKALRVTFSSATRGLVLRGSGGFELAGDDGRFVPATPVLAGDDVVLTAAGVAAPRHVRYAFAAVPEFSLWNGAELPAAPFRASIR